MHRIAYRTSISVESDQVSGLAVLMENASHAFLDAVRKSMRQIRAGSARATIDPDLLTAAP